MIHFNCTGNNITNWIQIRTIVFNDTEKIIKFIIPPENRRLRNLLNDIVISESDNIAIDGLVCLCLACLPAFECVHHVNKRPIYCYFNFYCSNYIHNYCSTKMNIYCYPVIPSYIYNFSPIPTSLERSSSNTRVVISIKSEAIKVTKKEEVSVVYPVIMNDANSFEQQIKDIDKALIVVHNKVSAYIVLFFLNNKNDFGHTTLCNFMTICMCLEEKVNFQFKQIPSLFSIHLSKLASYI